MAPLSMAARVPSETMKHHVADENHSVAQDASKPNRPMTAEEEFVWEKSSSRFNYYAGYVTNSSTVVFLLSRAFFSNSAVPSLFSFIMLACSGILIWTCLEYWLHRLGYHHGPRIFVTGHHMHHEAPKAYLGLPYYFTFTTYIGLYFFFRLFFDPAKLGVFMAFLWLGYLSYNVVHHGTHHWASKSFIFKKLKAHHLVHHYYPEQNFAISFPPWDYVFRTIRK